MTMAQSIPTGVGRRRRKDLSRVQIWDTPLLLAAGALLALGLVMVASSSVTMADRELGAPFVYLQRQVMFAVLGVGAAVPMVMIRLKYWQPLGPPFLLLALALLTLVLVPGIGKEVNGSTRWLPLGVFHLQVSELAKLLILVYLADYLVRRGDELRSEPHGFLKPVALLCIACALLLMEPDFGAVVVLLVTAFGMMYLAGVRIWQFAGLVALAGAGLAVLAFVSPYRWSRVVSFLNPWADPYNSGFQLVQSLIAFGRGGWFGVGLGDSIQKLFYLPEAHTDFVFAVIAEELGLLGSATVICLFGLVVWRAYLIGARAERNGQHFPAYLAYGVGLWIGIQAFINIGVSMGVLPTKGLTLPLVSYGGSSLVVTCVAIGLLLRIGHETALAERGAGATGRKRG